MGNTQAKLAPIIEQAELGARNNTSKRQASSPLLGTSIKRQIIAVSLEDTTDYTHDELSDLPKDNQPGGSLRDSLDEDEKFLELPQLFDLVGVVARKYELDDKPLHKDYRGQDLISSFRSDSGKLNVTMSKVRTFRPVTAIVDSVDIGKGKQHKHETFVLGREKEGDAQWLNVSYRLDTQLPHLVLRVSAPSMRDAHGRYEPVYVYIFATNLSQAPYMPIHIKTGKNVSISKKRKQRLTHIRPRLLEKVEEGLVTETSLHLNRVDKGHMDVEGRLSRPVIVGSISRTELDKMAAELIDGKTDQPPHEKLLGLIHGDRIRQGLDLFTEYDGDNVMYESAREANFCKLFRLTMILCNELGNLWAYRLQHPDISWTDESFPFEKLQPPRWTVRKWFARADQKGNDQAVLAASPAQWQGIHRPKALPGPEEESFLRGLDALKGDSTSLRAFVREGHLR